MIAYYSLYQREAGVGPPEGLLVLETETGDGLYWDHRAQAWRYDRALVARTVFDWKNEDRIDPVGRADAEQVAMVVTGAAEPLPDEDTIRWIFQWQGEPPRGESQAD